MRRTSLRHHLFGLAAFVSLLLCVTIIVLWARSYFRWDVIGDTVMPRDGANWYWRRRMAFSEDGGVRLVVYGVLVNTPRFVRRRLEKVGQREHVVARPGQLGPRELSLNHWFGFYQSRKQQAQGSMAGPEVIYMDTLQVRLPYWSPGADGRAASRLGRAAPARIAACADRRVRSLRLRPPRHPRALPRVWRGVRIIDGDHRITRRSRVCFSTPLQDVC